MFALLPRLLERAGTSPKGSITGLYTVLVDGDDMNEPIADAVRSILDGHIVLTRALAHAGHYPSIDVLQSVSRLVGEIVTPEVQAAGQQVRAALAAYRDKEDLISIGAYQRGSDPLVDVAIDLRPTINAFLRQRVDDPSTRRRRPTNALLAIGGGARGGSDGSADRPGTIRRRRRADTVSPAGGPSAIPSLSLAS